MTTLNSATLAVTRARKAVPGNDPLTDTAPAARRVQRILAPLALEGLTSTLQTTLTQVAAATTTADLRQVATDTFQLRVGTEDTAAVLGESSRTGIRASHLEAAVAALASMKEIDGDHLDGWAPISARLQTHLQALGEPTTAVSKADQMIDAASLVMKAWEELHAGPTKADLASYHSRLTRAMRTWSTTWNAVPNVTADDPPSFALTTRWFRSEQKLERAVTSLQQVSVPDDIPASLRTAHAALIARAKRGHSAAVAGHAMALAGEDCGTDCTLGQSDAWASFTSALAKVGDVAATKTAWQSAYDDAITQAAAAPDDADRPVV